MRAPDVTAGAASNLEPRFRVTHFLPVLLLVVLLGALLLAGVPAKEPTFSQLDKRISAAGWGAVAVAVLSSLFVALLLRPFQLQLVRLLEGYWGDGLVANKIATYLRTSELMRLEAIGYRMAAAEKGVRKNLADSARRLQATPPSIWRDRQLRLLRRLEVGPETAPRLLEQLQWFPSRERVLPTRLGNILRSIEESAGERYGLNTITVWPRLHQLASDPLREQLQRARDDYDTAARMCAGLAVFAAVTAALLIPEGGWWRALPFVLSLLSWIAYRSACAGARYWGLLVHTAFDLHRFDLLTRLRVELPATRSEELLVNRELSELLATRQPAKSRRRYARPAGLEA